MVSGHAKLGTVVTIRPERLGGQRSECFAPTIGFAGLLPFLGRRLVRVSGIGRVKLSMGSAATSMMPPGEVRCIDQELIQRSA
jgi:hypothetical protein